MEVPVELCIGKSDPVVIVDGSYFVFHRFFATLKWYKFRMPDSDDATIMRDPEYSAAVQKHALADLVKLRKNVASIVTGKPRLSKKDWENIPMWFAMDCHRADIWRSSVTTGYKGTRDAGRALFDPSCFKVLYDRLESEVPIIRVPALEADDIVALTHKQLRQIGHEGLIVCITNDNDYLQLVDANTRLFNLEGKDIALRGCGNPKKDLLFKILLGDKSDNIMPVRKKLTEKRLREMVNLEDDEIIQELGLTNDETVCFEHNRMLIDFSMIPERHVNAFNETVKFATT